MKRTTAFGTFAFSFYLDYLVYLQIFPDICRYLQFPQSFSVLVLCFGSSHGGPGGQGTGAPEFSRKTLGPGRSRFPDLNHKYHKCSSQVCSNLFKFVFNYFSRVSFMCFILFGSVVPIFPM